MTRRYIFELRWGNPYTEPPNGQPRVLISITREQTSGHPFPEEILNHPMNVPGNGYSLSARVDPVPQRRLSEAAKGSLRLKSLERRVLKQAPLFAADIIAEQVAKNPDYYAGKPFQLERSK